MMGSMSAMSKMALMSANSKMAIILCGSGSRTLSQIPVPYRTVQYRTGISATERKNIFIWCLCIIQ
jgi:hypothetical protein